MVHGAAQPQQDGLVVEYVDGPQQCAPLIAASGRLRGGRADAPGDFPDDDYAHMTPAERMAAVIRSSRRLFATKASSSTDAERRHPGLPNRLVGGRR